MKPFARIFVTLAVAAAVLPPAGARAATTEVSIKSGAGNEFNPATVVVHVGDFVRWTNDDRTLFQTDHNVMADDGSFSSKQRMKEGTSFEFQFTAAGTFTYHCTIHGWSGTVIVIAPRPSRTATPTPAPAATHTTRPKPSRSPTPSATPGSSTRPSPTPSFDASGIGSSGPSSAGKVVSIAIVAIAVLVLLGYFVYVRFVRSD